MNEATQQVAPSAEPTQALSGQACPICETGNPPLSVWCVECGFRLDSEPGSAPVATPHYSVSDGKQTIFLKPGDNIVGRLNAEVFLSDPSVSRKHAVITVGEAGVSVRDEGSANGTRLDGQALTAGESVAWAPGKTVEFGTARLKLVSPDGEGDLEIVPEVTAVSDAVAWLTSDGLEYALGTGTTTIGRKPENDIVIADAYVSGRHASVFIETTAATLTDEGSANGTFIGDTRLEVGQPVTLEEGTTIRFARVDLRFEWAVMAPEDSGA